MSKRKKTAEAPKTPIEAAAEYAAETLTGDLRNSLLTHVRAMETPWSKMSERDQGDKIDAIERMAEDVVRRAVGIIATRGFEVIHVKIADYTVKGGAIKGKFEAIVSEVNVVSLADHQSKTALIVLADVEDFFGESAAAKPDPDEPELPVGEPADPDDEDDDQTDMESIGSAIPPIPATPSHAAA